MWIDIQHRFSKHNEGAAEKEKTRERIGIYMGGIVLKDDDVLGSGLKYSLSNLIFR